MHALVDCVTRNIMFEAPECVRAFISNDEWNTRIHQYVRFDSLPMMRRLDFVQRFASRFDWSRIAYVSLLDPADVAQIREMFTRSVLKRVDHARVLLCANDEPASHAVYLSIMRASPMGVLDDVTVTSFGSPASRHQAMTLLGDIIAWEWSRVQPKVEHVRLTHVVQLLIKRGIPPELIPRVM